MAQDAASNADTSYGGMYGVQGYKQAKLVRFFTSIKLAYGDVMMTELVELFPDGVFITPGVMVSEQHPKGVNGYWVEAHSSFDSESATERALDRVVSLASALARENKVSLEIHSYHQRDIGPVDEQDNARLSFAHSGTAEEPGADS